jgi:16S rRNA (adenine1518-N6/adenine1519-N6)-dimethyltransferase
MLRRLGLKPKQSWGQNFLSDDAVLDRMADEAMLVPGDAVIELGPGLGHFTRHLLATGARVIAVERDRDMVRALEQQQLPGLQLVEGNAATTDFARTAAVDQVIVVGNLPYHLTSQILFSVLAQVAHVPRALFLLQREVVERLAAEPGSRDYGLPTVLLGFRYRAESVLDVPRSYFHPPPKVDSAVLRLTRLAKPRAEVIDLARFDRLVRAGFAHRRKTLINTLKSDAELGDGPTLLAALATAGIDPTRRAETLSVEEFAAIERALPPPAPKAAPVTSQTEPERGG